MADRNPHPRWAQSSLWFFIPLALIALVIVWTAVDDSEPTNDGPSQSYEICAANAERNGLDSSDPGFLTAVGLCMDRLER